ncbi:FimV N-terminal domain protein, partial [Burkholderiales bacterium JOSHI_001]
PPPAEAPAPAPVAKAPAVKPPRTESEAPKTAKATDGNAYRVRSGDNLSRIAARTARGVSLDQMLVALYRGNPQAFIDNNMNRLKAGAVLSVPAAEAARGVTPSEARQVIQAQSADFSAYRQRLAGAVPTTRPAEPARQAKGKVQAEVQDRKQAAAPTPDQLKLSQGAVRASAPEAQISKATEKKAAADRVAELNRNLEELKNLQKGAAGARAPASAPTVVAAAPTLPAVQAPVAPPPPAPAPAAPPPRPVAASAPVAAASKPASAAVVAPVASAAMASASLPQQGASMPTVALKPPQAAGSAPKASPVVPAPADEPGWMDSLLENPLALPAGGAVALLLGGFAFYRLRGKRKDSGETSFLESRLQPDSFFGASGGQRVDTRDAAGGASSSMSYSLSQLDAIGDVDPVAEADVYLAYGRDLQAEEILKEAMRSTPERLAIRSKLLEVYAKRRDTKGYELLATQLYSLVKGEGEDWAKAQEQGRQIDPENPLYQPGGKPANVMVQDGGRMVEPLGASTMPQSVMPSTSSFGPSGSDLDAATEVLTGETPSQSGVDLDLDLDIDQPSVFEAPLRQPPEATRPMPEPLPEQDSRLDFDLGNAAPPLPPLAKPAAPAPAAAPAASDSGPMDFDLGSISLDLDATIAKPAAALQKSLSPDPALDFSDFALPSSPAPLDAADPLARKLELAEEFRQIGDVEGARDLLEEVLAKSSGALKAKAQGMLDDLA